MFASFPIASVPLAAGPIALGSIVEGVCVGVVTTGCDLDWRGIFDGECVGHAVSGAVLTGQGFITGECSDTVSAGHKYDASAVRVGIVSSHTQTGSWINARSIWDQIPPPNGTWTAVTGPTTNIWTPVAITPSVWAEV